MELSQLIVLCRAHTESLVCRPTSHARGASSLVLPCSLRNASLDQLQNTSGADLSILKCLRSAKSRS